MRTAFLPNSVKKLVNELTKLPSVGEKSALRLVQHLLSKGKEEIKALEESLEHVRQSVKLCDLCFAITEQDLCSVCSDPNRKKNTICVVEKPVDVLALEQVGGYRGQYHVLHGLWSPMKGIGAEKLKLSELFQRIDHSMEDSSEDGSEGNSEKITELIIATSATVEGDATAFYIGDHISDQPISVTRLAQGLPKGGELEYADEITLRYAFEGRKVL